MSMDPKAPDGSDFLAGGGEMAKLVREMDWSKTPLGPIESWSQSLRTTVSLCLASNFPISIAWGPERTQIYNDGYWPICGAKHPRSMGQDFKECWFSAWPAIGAAFESAAAGRSAFLVNQRMFLDRYGYLEETFFTFSFSPIRDESGRVAGLFHPVTELTQQSLAERRLKVLRAVTERTADARSVEEACGLIAQTLGEHDLDLPFVLLYLVHAGAKAAVLADGRGLSPGTPARPARLMLTDASAGAWPIAEAIESGRAIEVDCLEERFGRLSSGPYPEAPNRALVLPIAVAGLDHPLAVLVAGVSSRRELDEPYRTFYALLADTITNAMTNARAYEEERKRAEALAELDRAKTAFFSNVSHEFRTPLTLMLGPLEDTLAQSNHLADADRERLATAHRNSLRLLKLVNTLLDFSRIEAGRIEASYEPTDLAVYTAELASVFRSAVEKAGLELVVDCSALPERVYVDREMWEKIVLNLLSNAFKFTFEGRIEVTVKASDERRVARGEKNPVIGDSALSSQPSALAAPHVVLTVSDTGVGIAHSELPKIFERFHRVRGARSRTHEGTGIGLALVHELARLHGGTVRAESEVGHGSRFIVTIPFGKAHLAQDRIAAARNLASTALRGEAFVEEVLRWLPDESDARRGASSEEVATGSPAPAHFHAPLLPHPRILWADDNADMREYVTRLLSAAGFVVEAVADGQAALVAARRDPPELVLSDIMMPVLDGFGLLRELRGDPELREIPVILLSARAGEESRIEGVEAGADDYLVKPFSARELLARVESNVRLARVRRQGAQTLRESEERFRAFTQATSDVVYRMSPDWTEMRHLQGREFIADTLEPSRTWLKKYIHSDDQTFVTERIHRAIRSKSPFELEHRVIRTDGTLGWTYSRAIPIRDSRGEVIEWFGAASDITARKQSEDALRESEERYRRLIGLLPVAVYTCDSTGVITFYNETAAHLWGRAPRVGDTDERFCGSFRLWRPDGTLLPHDQTPMALALREGREFRNQEVVIERPDGSRIHVLVNIDSTRDAQGQVAGAINVFVDMTPLKLAEHLVAEQRNLLEMVATGLPIEQCFLRLTEAVTRLQPNARAAILLLGAARDGIEAAFAAQIRPSFGAGILGPFLSSKPVTCPDIERDSAGSQAWRESCRAHGIRGYHAIPVSGADGETVAWFVLGFGEAREPDAWERRIAESGAHIASIVIERDRSVQALRDLSQRKDEFLANMSHEIRSPLTGIMGYADLLMDRLKDPEDLEFVRTIKESGDYLIEIVNDILDLSKIEAGKLVLNIEPVPVHAVLTEVQSLLAARARQKKLPLGLRYETALPEAVQTDRTRLRQILINLVSNGIKFTEQGRVDIVSRVKDGSLELEVVDTGIGIAPAHQKILFQPFTQADTSSTRQYGGTGLGLTITHRLVEMLRGKISFESEQGKGSTFRVTLPAGDTAAETAPRRRLPELDRVKPMDDVLLGKRVLVVDDRAEIRHLVGRYIREAGGRPAEAAEGERAIEAIAEAGATEPFDAVVLDLHMPEMDGYEVVRALRASGFRNPVIALTARAMVGDREKCLQAGFDDYLTKPIDRRKLVGMLG